MQKKKYLIYGENWEGTNPSLLYSRLRDEGYPARIFDHTDILPGVKERSFIGRVKRRLFGSYYARKINRQFLQELGKWEPDIVLVSKGLHLERSTLQKIKASGAYLANWNPDDFLNLKNSNRTLIQSIPDYDLIVSPREHRFSLYEELGARDLLFLDWYYVPELHIQDKKSLKYEISFVGSWSPRREKFIGQINKRFHIWGGGWEKSSSEFRDRHHVHLEILNQREMCQVYASSKYNLNILTAENEDTTNLRIFEVTAAGGLLLTERNDATSRYVRDGEEALMYSSVDEINDILQQDLNTENVAEAGQKKILNGKNSFQDRVSTLFKYLDNVKSS